MHDTKYPKFQSKHCTEFYLLHARLAGQVDVQRQEMQRALLAEAKKLSEVTASTAELKCFAEATMSGLLNGRPINIMGEINKVI